ncbi:MAG TPA: signal peptidase II [Clostridiales bacterium]|nr:signal peptidase II [Clostridiales bacterium]
MIWYLISIFVVVIDQLTKYVIKENLAYGEKIPVIENFLYITHHTNTGAAWGILSNATVLLTVFSGLMILLMAFIIPKFHHKLLKWAFCLVLGGAAGNQIDRMFLGEVTDFIATFFWGYSFPVFNVADSAIVIGSILLLIYMFFFYDDADFAFLDFKKRKEKEA